MKLTACRGHCALSRRPSVTAGVRLGRIPSCPARNSGDGREHLARSLHSVKPMADSNKKPEYSRGGRPSLRLLKQESLVSGGSEDQESHRRENRCPSCLLGRLRRRCQMARWSRRRPVELRGGPHEGLPGGIPRSAQGPSLAPSRSSLEPQGSPRESDETGTACHATAHFATGGLGGDQEIGGAISKRPERPRRSPQRLDGEQGERRIAGDQTKGFDLALGGEHPVERVAMGGLVPACP